MKRTGLQRTVSKEDASLAHLPQDELFLLRGGQRDFEQHSNALDRDGGGRWTALCRERRRELLRLAPLPELRKGLAVGVAYTIQKDLS